MRASPASDGFVDWLLEIAEATCGKESLIFQYNLSQVEEETGIKLNLEGMVDLTASPDPATGCRMLPSPGGCDEEIGMFLYRGHVDEETIRLSKGRKRACDHGELIKLRVVPYDQLWRTTSDAKALSAIALYEMGANRLHKASSVILILRLGNLHVQQACPKDKGYSPLTWMTQML
nr:nudix hydrolase 14, chloroplastic [Aegilops tauschii subsp. strangulata]